MPCDLQYIHTYTHTYTQRTNEHVVCFLHTNRGAFMQCEYCRMKSMYGLDRWVDDCHSSVAVLVDSHRLFCVTKGNEMVVQYHYCGGRSDVLCLHTYIATTLNSQRGDGANGPIPTPLACTEGRVDRRDGISSKNFACYVLPICWLCVAN
ncbi:hypothetical protein BU24DRAFT_128625 [Aaosphaeria arxii CBS 175.79]|uniref:Uncharacterized protein n=1 Tax=Aaosphaeria arxii CBS 175.79 TaxID=1450172 RepID=A0A6A5Y367_9PLEO|nr:uncharacterized protein BU24DRAFT_128625 [Aaosphaeria arxii CBS 175.79]KAF2019888.1 hypothetical protein BU24DRAFT_128625 [Aaosphaeria arxii CBS 175.79]